MADLDLKNVSTDDLIALKNAVQTGDYSGISTDTLMLLTAQQAQSPQAQEPALIRGARSGMRWMAGMDKQPSIPTLGQGISLDFYDITPGQKTKLITAITTTIDDERLAKSIKNIMGDTQVALNKDQYGNLIVALPVKGQKDYYAPFYPNPRGLDMPTAAQISGGIAVGAPLAAMAPETALGSAIVGGTEATGYEWLSAKMANESMGLSPTIWGSVFGPAISLVARGLGAIGTAFTNRFKNYTDILDPKTGALTQDAQAFLRNNGLDPEAVRADIFAEVRKRIEAGAIPEAAQTAAQARALPVPIDLTQGQGPAGSQRQQVFESQVLA
ncbi:MAG: hypothetical protein VW907_09550, partial [Opitutae bacterium]